MAARRDEAGELRDHVGARLEVMKALLQEDDVERLRLVGVEHRGAAERAGERLAGLVLDEGEPRLRHRLQLGVDVDAGDVAALDRRPQGFGAAAAADLEDARRPPGADEVDELATLARIIAPHVRAEVPAVAAVIVVERLLLGGGEDGVREPPGKELVDRAGTDVRQRLHRVP